MKKSNKVGTFMLIGLGLGLAGGVGGAMYYAKKHPIKTQVLMNDAKNMMKDLK